MTKTAMTKYVRPELTLAEAEALRHAAGSGTIDDGIDSIGFGRFDKLAYHRAEAELGDAIKEAQYPTINRRRPRLTDIEWYAVEEAVVFRLAGEHDLDEADSRALVRAARKLGL